jgi:putative endonuclease
MENREMKCYVYLLRCGDGSLYTGYTDDVERRLAVHQSGKGAKYTRSRLPVELVYSEELPDKSAALRREAAIKKLTREKKLALIERGGNAE